MPTHCHTHGANNQESYLPADSLSLHSGQGTAHTRPESVAPGSYHVLRWAAGAGLEFAVRGCLRFEEQLLGSKKLWALSLD